MFFPTLWQCVILYSCVIPLCCCFCISLGCSGNGGNNFGEIVINKPQISSKPLFVSNPKVLESQTTGLQCITNHQDIICGVDISDNPNATGGLALFDQSGNLVELYYPKFPSIITPFSIQSYPVFEGGHVFATNGDYLVGLDVAHERALGQAVYINLQGEAWSLGVTANEIIMIPSNTGDITGYLTTGIPHASIRLVDTIDSIPGQFNPLAKPNIQDSTMYFITKFNHFPNICRVYSVIAEETQADRLKTAWYQPFACELDKTSHMALTPSILLSNNVLVFARGQADNNTIFGLQDLGNSSEVLFDILIPHVPGGVVVSGISVLNDTCALLTAANSTFLSVVCINSNSSVEVSSVSPGPSFQSFDLADSAPGLVPVAKHRVMIASQKDNSILAFLYTESQTQSQFLSKHKSESPVISIICLRFTCTSESQGLFEHELLWRQEIPGDVLRPSVDQEDRQMLLLDGIGTNLSSTNILVVPGERGVIGYELS